ncbi:MAG TPA: hypothetical protein VK034_11705, partial [Enhygromyxa sp.]|nr:hypothetical protein [Enhygromyxa sp.]
MALDGSPLTIGVLAVTLLGACASTPADPAAGPDPEAKSTPVGVMAHALHAPDPDLKALQNTAAARFHKSDGVAVIGFCIDVHGQTGDFEVLEPFPGDPMVDEILVATIATWRFTPFMV